MIDKLYSKYLLTKMYAMSEILKKEKYEDKDFDLDKLEVKGLNIQVVGYYEDSTFTFIDSNLASSLKYKLQLNNSFTCEELELDKLGIIALQESGKNMYYVVANDEQLVLVIFNVDRIVELPTPRIPIYVSRTINEFEYQHKPSTLQFLSDYNVEYTEEDGKLIIPYPVVIPKFLWRKEKTVYRDIIFEFDGDRIKNLVVEQRRKTKK